MIQHLGVGQTELAAHAAEAQVARAENQLLMRAATSAPAHITHGSSVVYKVAPSSR